MLTLALLILAVLAFLASAIVDKNSTARYLAVLALWSLGLLLLSWARQMTYY
jgi:hypothetical protein